jgi:hypothetical protein
VLRQDTSRVVVCILCALSIGCHAPQPGNRSAIQFIRIPQADAGGPDKFDIIEGTVTGAHPGQQVVLYSRSQSWWVQPLANQPFTKIQPNARWTNSTHLGSEYAALLVDPGYSPPARLNELPAVGGAVAAVAVAKGQSSPPSPIIRFSGYEWRVRTAGSRRGGVQNPYHAGNVSVDSDGAMHLRIVKAADKWSCAEVSLTRSLGYGTYSFVVRDTSHLEPAAVFSMFTYDYARAEQNYGEMAIEISQWGNPVSKNAQYIIQPFYVPANVVRFAAPSGTRTHSFRWEAGRVEFRTVRGANTSGVASPVAEHVFVAGVPTHAAESVRMNLYVFGAVAQPMKNGAEVVIEKFEYLP